MFENVNIQSLGLGSLGDLETMPGGFHVDPEIEKQAALTQIRTLMNGGQARKAVTELQAFMVKHGETPGLLGDLGVILRHLNQPIDACAFFTRAIALLHKGKPDPKTAALIYTNYSTALFDMGRLAESRRASSLSYMIMPNPLALWSQTIATLGDGDLAAGWPLFERRTKLSSYCAGVEYGVPNWDGKNTCENLLLVGEQGVGERILYACTMAEVQNISGAQIHIELVDEVAKLKPLFERSFPYAKVALTDSTLPLNNTTQCLMGDTVRMLRPTLESFPKHRGYLKADEQRAAKIRAELPGSGPIIGLSWRSSNLKFGAHKGVDLSQLASLFFLPGVRFVNLQYLANPDEIKAVEQMFEITIEQPLTGKELYHDVDGTAAVIAACDHVVTVSNINAHMAGALGKPVSLLLRNGYGRVWYWLSGRQDSPFYPSMRIYRQDDDIMLGKTISRLAADLVGGLSNGSTGGTGT